MATAFHTLPATPAPGLDRRARRHRRAGRRGRDRDLRAPDRLPRPAGVRRPRPDAGARGGAGSARHRAGRLTFARSALERRDREQVRELLAPDEDAADARHVGPVRHAHVEAAVGRLEPADLDRPRSCSPPGRARARRTGRGRCGRRSPRAARPSGRARPRAGSRSRGRSGSRRSPRSGRSAAGRGSRRAPSRQARTRGRAPPSRRRGPRRARGGRGRRRRRRRSTGSNASTAGSYSSVRRKTGDPRYQAIGAPMATAAMASASRIGRRGRDIGGTPERGAGQASRITGPDDATMTLRPAA